MGNKAQTAVTVDDIRTRNGSMTHRQASVGAVDVGARTVELAFSSEEPAQRWWGFEILSHDPSAVMLERIGDSAPLLLDHDWGGQIGVIERVSIDADRRGRATVRFSKSARAEEVLQDIADGIRKHVSVGYRIHDAEQTGVRDGDPVWTVTRWEPMEISIVAVPADHTVGVGRSAGQPSGQPHPLATTAAREAAPAEGAAAAGMVPVATGSAQDRSSTEQPPAQPASQPAPAARTEHQPGRRADEQPHEERTMGMTLTSHGAPGADEKQTEADVGRAAEAERARVRTILEMGEMYRAPELARKAAADGTEVGAFQRQLLDHITKAGNAEPLTEQTRAADIGMNDREVGRYSFLKVVRALINPSDARAQKEAAFELEASRSAAERLGRQTDGVIVPPDVLSRALNSSTTGTGGENSGGNLIATNLMASSFIDILRNRSTIMQLGATLGGLVGNVDIPRQVSASQGYWIGEDEDAGKGNTGFGLISGSPKTAAAYFDITRRMLMQSTPDAEALVRRDLATALALTIDAAGYYGTGTDKQPRGIANHTGINAVTFKAEQPSFGELVAMETEISADNADVASMAYVADSHFRGHAKTTLRHEGVAGTIWEVGNTVNGYRTEITNQIRRGDVFMGNFADLVILMWGGLELRADPYSKSLSGTLRITAFQDVDFILRRTESFCLGRKAS